MPYSNVKKHNAIEELESMSNGMKHPWRRSASKMSIVSATSSVDAKSVTDLEDIFMHAAEFGDVETVRRMLTESPHVNVDCVDTLGRIPLQLAVKNDHLEVVEQLLDRSSKRHVMEAVMQAISAGHVLIAETILKHKRYLEIWKDRKKFGDDDHFFKTQFEDSQFSPDLTPLILAAQKNQFEIVQLLLMRGDRIQSPHKFSCQCQECENKRKFDQLRAAKYRLNAYRGLASDAYISLSSKDPILTAFQLAKELGNLAKDEKCFKQEYRELRKQLSEYVVKLLDRVRTHDELELVLNKTGKPGEDRYSTLARLRLAVQYQEKKFVAHPSCQQRLDKSWLEGIDSFKKAGIFKKVSMVAMFLLAYPVLILIYIAAPNADIKGVRALKYPWIKFAVHSISYIAFLVMIAVFTVEATSHHSRDYTLGNLYPDIYQKYNAMRNVSAQFRFGEDLPLRPMLPSPLQLLISIWIAGNLCHECVQIYQAGFDAYVSSFYNIMDFAILAVYVCSFTLKYVAMVKVHIAIRYLATAEMANIAAQDMNYTQYSLYWIVADRFYWLTWDPINLSEGLFAVANVLTFSRISYFLPVNAALGPLQISVGRMIRDIIKCLCLITMVLVAFVIGLQNVYSYYHVRRTIELIDHKIKPEAEEAFGDIVSTFRTVFWSVFGRGGTDVVLLDQYNNYVTENFGNFLYGLYNVIMVTVLINMLIAMMARSFQAIAEEADIEWKFARSVLYLEYMSNGQVLPVPLNLARIPRGLLEWFCIRCDVTEENLEPPVDHDIYGNDVTNVTHGLNNDEASPALPKALRKEPSAAASPASKRQRISSAASGMSAFGKKLHRRSTVRKTSLPGSVSGVNQYQKVMQRIVQRYIFDIQREEEITEDDFNGIKQDLSGLRHEMLSILNRQSLVDVFDTAFSTRRPSKDYLEDISKRRRSAMSKLRNLRLASRFSGSTDSKRAEQGEVDENLVVQENDEDLIPEDQLADEGDTEHNGGAEDDLEEADTEHNGGAEDDLEEADTEHNGGAEDDLEEADTESQTANYGHINRQGLTDEADDNNDPNVEDEYVDDGYQENQDNDFDATSAGDLYGQVNDALSKVKIYE